MKPLTVLWAGILVGPLVWFANLETNFALAPLACGGKGKLAMYIVSAVSLILVALAGSGAYFQLRQPHPNAAPQTLPSLPPRRAMAIAGVALSCLFFLTIAAQAIPNIMLEGCE